MAVSNFRMVLFFSSLLIAVGACIAIVSCSGGGNSTAIPVVKEGQQNDPKEEGPSLFKQVTQETGINFTYKNGEDDVVYAIIESLGGGIGLIDFDKDGLLDIFFTAGGYYEGKKVLGNPCKLYRNLGKMKFKDVSKEVGLEEVKWCYSHGVTVGDYDRDGYQDLLVSGYNRLHLLHNEPGIDGGRKFVDVTEKAKLTEKIWSSCTAFADLDGDGYPEIYVTHYGDWGFDTNHPEDCYYHDNKTRDVCQPRKFKPLVHALYQNNGNGTFADITRELKPSQGGHGLGVCFVDINLDGKPDIYVANDTDDNYLYINKSTKKGEFKFVEVGLFAGVARDDRGNQNGSMGVDASSYDRSGKPSIIVTNYENELPALYANRSTQEQASFLWGSSTSGLAIVGGNYVSWGTSFFDAENRGWEDLMIVSGHAIRHPLAKFGRLQKPVLMKNNKGRFKVNTPQGGEYFNEMHNARGLAIGDLDNDGKLDILVSHLNAPVVILQNVSEHKNHWVGFQMSGENNRNVVGARILLTANGETQYRFVKGGGSYASSSDQRVHFGLGEANKIDKVVVEWPNGKTQEWTDIKIDQYQTLTEGK